MDQSSVAILVDAKKEYTDQLINILRSPIYIGIQSIYNDAKTICTNDNKPNDTLMTFQDLLSRIPKWSQDIINKEYSRILECSKCDWIEDLLKVIYIAHIKVLTIVNNPAKHKKINLKIPTGNHFMHLCYIEIAREFWKNPYLFSDRVNKLEYQKNMKESENIIGNCIIETIRKQLPVRHILKEYFEDTIDENSTEETSSKSIPNSSDATINTNINTNTNTASDTNIDSDKMNDSIKNKDSSEKVEESGDKDITKDTDTNENKELNPKYVKKIESIIKKELKANENIEYNNKMVDAIRKIITEELEKRIPQNPALTEDPKSKIDMKLFPYPLVQEITEKVEHALQQQNDTTNSKDDSNQNIQNIQNNNTENTETKIPSIITSNENTENIENNTNLNNNNNNISEENTDKTVKSTESTESSSNIENKTPNTDTIENTQVTPDENIKNIEIKTDKQKGKIKGNGKEYKDVVTSSTSLNNLLDNETESQNKTKIGGNEFSELDDIDLEEVNLEVTEHKDEYSFF